jgi:tetratricopeptide (TPR) repeat protein
VRSTAIELEPLPREESERLAALLLEQHELPADVRTRLLDKTEGNPLFVEETVRMVLESGDDAFDRIPDTLQALIAARIDRLPTSEKLLLQRASVIGRVFWAGALAYLSPDFGEELEDALDDLVLRDLLTHEQRSTITGEQPFRFKHVLIREVAYSGLPKAARAEYHQKFAAWLKERADKELLEIRAYHLDHATALLSELDGRAPAELVDETAHVLEIAGKRALTREASQSARKLLVRAVELQPTLERRYNAARAAWKLADLAAVQTEMGVLVDDADREGNNRIKGRALTALSDVTLAREGDATRARELADHALAVFDETDFEGRFGALDIRSLADWYEGKLSSAEEYETQALETARLAGRKDLESKATIELAQISLVRSEDAQAAPLIGRALELADESGSIVARANAAMTKGEYHRLRGELEEAELWYAQSLGLFTEAGSNWGIGRSSGALGRIAWRNGDPHKAEKLLREAIRTLAPMQERGTLCEGQRLLAQLLLEQGRVDEAEKYALAARETVSAEDISSRATTRVALAQVRAAQDRHDEAESLFREAIDIIRGSEQCRIDVELVPPYAQFLRDLGRADEAAELESSLGNRVASSAA